ncbi:hypothetical protein SDC9_138471 [bioreactor metagenome]|uniref:D-alanyl-D-alanine carboxypeptidase-like core domain-containing protein n=1 Tax=bioreactor metagenome TaxID=1076179 RepID=A0A645DRK7_9ZZZZ
MSNLYRQTNNDLYIPGHSVYQLGVQLDFTLTNVDETAYSTSSIAVWLSENAYQYGFIQVDQDQGFANHYRYVGVDLANLLFTQKLTLADYNNE